MKYGINNWVYPGEAPRVTFARLARFGYDGIELRGEPAEYDVAEIKRLCREFSLEVFSVLEWSIWGIPGRDFADPDPEERAEALRYGRDCVDLLAAVDGRVLVTLPFPAGRTAPLSKPQTEADWQAAVEEEWGHAVDSVRKLGRYAAPHGITLAVEPISRFETFAINTVDDGLRFLADVGESNVKLNLDTFHMNIEEADPAGAALKAGEKLAHMHVADSNRLAPGQGHTDFRGLMSTLARIGYNGAIVLEPVPDWPRGNAGLAVSAERNLPLRDQLAEAAIRCLKEIEAELVK